MTLELLRAEMDKLEFTSVQRQLFEADVPRARNAIAKAITAGAKNPASYAMSVFRSEPAPRERSTNRSVVVDCETCGGDRMVVFSTRANEASGWMRERGLEAVGETEEYAPCPDCNPNANTRRQGQRSPDPARVRERLTR